MREPDDNPSIDVLTVAMMFLASSRLDYLAREAGRLLIDKRLAIWLGGGRGVVALLIVLRPFLWGTRKLGALARARE